MIIYFSVGIYVKDSTAYRKVSFCLYSVKIYIVKLITHKRYWLDSLYMYMYYYFRIRVVNNKDELVLGCVLHMSTDTPANASLDCVILDPSEVPSITGIYETLVGNIVEISPICFDNEVNKYLVLCK